MTDLQKEFEATGYTSWINADLYPDGKIYTQEYTQWLERQVLALRQPPFSSRLFAVMADEYVILKLFWKKEDADKELEGYKSEHKDALFFVEEVDVH